MKHVEIEINDNKFEYKGETYDCTFAIKRDKENILREADSSHPGVVDELYLRETLTPKYCRVYLDENDNIVFAMVVYTICYKNSSSKRLACGDYYPPYHNVFHPHPYQGSICW